MAAHSSILAWRIPWTEEPGEIQSIGSESDTTEVTQHIHRMLELYNRGSESRQKGQEKENPLRKLNFVSDLKSEQKLYKASSRKKKQKITHSKVLKQERLLGIREVERKPVWLTVLKRGISSNWRGRPGPDHSCKPVQVVVGFFSFSFV